jgi:hypothetical protein
MATKENKMHIKRENLSVQVMVAQVSDVTHGPLVQLYDGGQCLLVEERTQIHYIQCIWGETTDLPQVT